MVRLLVVADDFTGALDTGVQFRAKDSIVLVYNEDAGNLRETLARDMQVLIVDTETRHMASDQAFRIVYNIVSIAVELGVSYIYKKTDSGMRGNIGSELAAFLFASGRNHIHYIPAFPKMGRITVGGIHYIDGVPVSESVFGSDPFEPVRKSCVKDIIAEQSDVEVHQMGRRISDGDEEGILVYDSTSEEEMYQLAIELKRKDQLHFLAGCAGFAAILFGMLSLEVQEQKQPRYQGRLLVVCGSINEVTVRQLDYASSHGIYRITLSPEQKLTIGWAESRKGRACIQQWKEKIQSCGDLLIECGVHDRKRTLEYIQRKGLAQTEVRRRIADAMGAVLKGLLDCQVKSTLLVTGGDTLLAFMQQIRQNTLTPLCEVYSGVVLSQFEYRGTVFNLISKSGGFGQDGLLLDLAELVKKQCAEKQEIDLEKGEDK